MFRRGEADMSPEGLSKSVELAHFEKMGQVRARVDTIVANAATADALKPFYRQFCKRPCFHDEYLDTFNRPTVELVDTQGRDVERITEKGIVARASGMNSTASFTRRASKSGPTTRGGPVTSCLAAGAPP